MNWQDLIPIYQVDEQLKFEITESEAEQADIACAMLRIYQGTSFSYPAFITPEAYEALMDYKSDWTREVGREPKSEDPIFKKEGTILRRTTPVGVKKRVERMINTTGLSNIRLDRMWGKMIGHRAKSRSVLFKLDKILRDGSETEEEKSISISYLYLASIDGVYGKNLKDVVIFDILSKGNEVNYQQVERMKLNEIEKYFEKIKGSECLFDGWDEDVRNAIAHSSFWYDEKKGRVVYEERRKNKVKEKTKDQVLKMIEKLSDIDELVFFYNQIFRINKVIFDLK